MKDRAFIRSVVSSNRVYCAWWSSWLIVSECQHMTLRARWCLVEKNVRDSSGTRCSILKTIKMSRYCISSICRFRIFFSHYCILLLVIILSLTLITGYLLKYIIYVIFSKTLYLVLRIIFFNFFFWLYNRFVVNVVETVSLYHAQYSFREISISWTYRSKAFPRITDAIYKKVDIKLPSRRRCSDSWWHDCI